MSIVAVCQMSENAIYRLDVFKWTKPWPEQRGCNENPRIQTTCPHTHYRTGSYKWTEQDVARLRCRRILTSLRGNYGYKGCTLNINSSFLIPRIWPTNSTTRQRQLLRVAAVRRRERLVPRGEDERVGVGAGVLRECERCADGGE